ncbi:subtilisin-like protease SBT1.6 [Wolffia australiana]
MAPSLPILLLLLLLLCTLQHPPAIASDLPKTYIIRVDHSFKPSVFPTHAHWYAASLLPVPSRPLHLYRTVFHGFSAVLPPRAAAALARHPAVLAVLPDRRRPLHTTRSPQFIGLRTRLGLWSDSDYGSDVVIGVLDTGVWPERRSFSDVNLGPVPSRWKGSCESGPSFPSSLCNNKLVGARFFSQGHAASAINATAEFFSPRDADGHGTHTASTAAGRHAFDASLGGYAAGIAKGVAPKSRLAVYKVCWRGAGCMDSDILAGFDAAVADGVDVISVSIGGGDGGAAPFYLDPIAIGSFGATARGVFVSSSAGNDGPASMSVTNLAPWLTTVGAGTIDRTFPAELVLGDGRRVAAVSLYSGSNLLSPLPLVYPGATGGLSAALCMDGALDPAMVRGAVVVCERGSSPRAAKGEVVRAAGGAAMVLVNGLAYGEGLIADAHVLPACAVGADEGGAVKAYASAGNATASIVFLGTEIGVKPAPLVASFSGRGPSGLAQGVLKPDLVAPGVNILAAWTAAVGPSGLAGDDRVTEFNVLSGTSMACPHVAGAAALLKSAHPSWSPAAVRSALMTTAAVEDNRRLPLADEATARPATALDFGAGLVNLDRAMDPGLVYDLRTRDYVEFLCAVGYEPKPIEVIAHEPVACPEERPAAENFNYPSFSVLFDGGAGNLSKSFARRVKNVGKPDSVYRAEARVFAKGVEVRVKPGKLVFSPGVTELGFVLSVSADARAMKLGDDGAAFGFLSWSDGEHLVRSPIVVSRMLIS